MRSSLFFSAAAVFLASTIPLCEALFADQAGVYDRHESFVGPFAHLISTVGAGKRAAGSNRAIFSTDAGVIASLDLARGNSSWRHILETGETLVYGAVASFDNYVAAAINTKSNGLVLRVINAADGSVADEAAVSAGERPSNVQVAAASGAVAVSTGTKVRSCAFSRLGKLSCGTAVTAGNAGAPIVHLAFSGEQLLVVSGSASKKKGGAKEKLQVWKVTPSSLQKLGGPVAVPTSGASFLYSSVRLVPAAADNTDTVGLLLLAASRSAAGSEGPAIVGRFYNVPSGTVGKDIAFSLPKALPVKSAAFITPTQQQGEASEVTATVVHAAFSNDGHAVFSLDTSVAAAASVSGDSGSSDKSAGGQVTSDGKVLFTAGGATLRTLHQSAGHLAVSAAVLVQSRSLSVVIAETLASSSGVGRSKALAGRMSTSLYRSDGVAEAVAFTVGGKFDLQKEQNQHGAVAKVFAVGDEGAILVHEDGAAHLIRTSTSAGAGASLGWTRVESHALAQQSLNVDVSTRHYSSSATAAAAVVASADEELSFSKRIASQIQGFSSSILGLPSTVVGLATTILSQPLSLLAAVVGGDAAGNTAIAAHKRKVMAAAKAGLLPPTHAGSILPLHSHAHVQKLVITRNAASMTTPFVDCGSHDGDEESAVVDPSEWATSFVSSGVLGSVTARTFEDGKLQWSLPLPASSLFRHVAAGLEDDDGSGGGAASSSSSSAAAPLQGYEVSVVASRRRPVQANQGELLVIETARLGAAADGNSKGGKQPRLVMVLSWVDASTGLVTASAVHEQDEGGAGGKVVLESVTRLPVVHSPSGRDVFAFTFTSSSSALMPAVIAPADVGAVAGGAALLSSDKFVLPVIEFDAASRTESIVGYGLDFASADARIVSSHSILGSAGGSELLLVPRVALWRYQAAFLNKGERLLAFAGNSAAEASHSWAASPSAVAGATGTLVPASLIHVDESAPVPAQILGDDSLLIKYQNPNTAVVIAGSAGKVESAFETARRQYREKLAGPAAPSSAMAAKGEGEQAEPSLSVTLLDLVTGRVLELKQHPGCSGPVAALKFDNWALFSYWNAKSARQEIAVGRMYEGALDTHDLLPWSKSVAAASASHKAVSPYAQEPPMTIQRTYVLPTVSSRRQHNRLIFCSPFFILSSLSLFLLACYSSSLLSFLSLADRQRPQCDSDVAGHDHAARPSVDRDWQRHHGGRQAARAKEARQQGADRGGEGGGPVAVQSRTPLAPQLVRQPRPASAPPASPGVEPYGV